MIVLHLPESFLPTYVGGKEVYTLRLTQYLGFLGVKNIVAIHGNESYSSSYKYEGVEVRVLPKLTHKTPYTDRYTREVASCPGFEELLKEVKPDIVHFHDQNNGASISHLRIVKQLGIKAVIIFHTPGQVCPQRALLVAGKKICDGRLESLRCTSCQLQSLFHFPPILANAITAISNIKSEEPKNKFVKLLSHRYMTNKFIESYHEVAQLADRIIPYNTWSENTYLINNINSTKLSKINTGGNSSINWDRTRLYKLGDTFEICYIGRCEWIKGIHLLIDAVKQLDSSISLKVYFYSQGWERSDYGRKLLKKIDNDNRFEKPRLVKNNELAKTISSHHACIIPSIWPETGPITVFDAFGSGLPIIGANSAGIAERVRHGIDGLLFENNSVCDLMQQLLKIIINPLFYNYLRHNILLNRTMDDVAKDTYNLYKTL